MEAGYRAADSDRALQRCEKAGRYPWRAKSGPGNPLSGCTGGSVRPAVDGAFDDLGRVTPATDLDLDAPAGLGRRRGHVSQADADAK